MSDSEKCKYQDNPHKESEIVKTVFYAVVISAWGSVVSNHQCVVFKFIEWLKTASRHPTALMSIGVFAFITLYFHDEWKYGRCKEYVTENVAVICWGWSLFLFQVCLLGKVNEASAACGIIGTGIITIGLLCTTKGKDSRPAKIRFATENLSWIISLFLFSIANVSCEWFVWLSLSPMLIIGFRGIISYGLPNGKTDEQKGGDKDED